MAARIVVHGTKQTRAAFGAAGKTAHEVNWQTGALEPLFGFVFSMPAIDRVAVAKSGVPAWAVWRLADVTGETKELMVDWLGLSRATVDRKVRTKKVLSVPESERVLGFIKLVGQVQEMVKESGNPEGFDAAKWVGEWLEKPMPALGGRPPGEFMNTVTGQEVVAGLLEKARSGVFA